MTQDGQRRTRKLLLVNLAWVVSLGLLLATEYVLSYAPLCRLAFGPDAGTMLIGRYGWQSAFVPVEWLHHHDPTAPLLNRWAELWGVNERMGIDGERWRR
jgi:hypothetical protein